MFHWHQVWKHMRIITKKDIEKRAIWELINHFENQMNRVIQQSLTEHKNLNEMKKIQGLDPKARIDKECVRRAIQFINSQSNQSKTENQISTFQSHQNHGGFSNK